MTAATNEAQETIDGQDYTHVQLDGRDYYLKMPRPGSVLVEVNCKRPGGGTAQPKPSESAKTEPANRTREFTDRLATGCAPKQGVAPERFTFEQRENKTAKQSQEAAKPAVKPETKLYPPGLDPHVVPEPHQPGDNFDPDQKRYY